MAVLVLRLTAPLQSWGCGSRYETRQTNTEVTKSGVIGLLSNALGRNREDDISDLVSLKFGVRVEQAGKVLRDYHTTSKWEDGIRKGNATITTRYYLQDAVFLVGLECDDEDFLKNLEYALLHPYRILYLGRRSCPVMPGFVLGVKQGSLMDVLQAEVWQPASWYQARQERLGNIPEVFLYVESAKSSETIAQMDNPTTFDFYHRGWTARHVLVKKLVWTDQQGFQPCETLLDVKDIKNVDFLDNVLFD